MSLLYKSTASQVVMLKLFLTSDHVTAATGKTVAITISKNGGTFANPNAGATNATEVSNGWYKVTLDATDTATEGDLVVRGTSASCDDSERIFRVHLPANFGVTSINGSGLVKTDVDTIKTNPVVNAGTVTFPTNSTLASTTNVTAGTITTTTNLTNLPAITAGWLTAAGIAADAITAAKVAADVTTELQSGLATSASIATLQTSVDDIPTNAELAMALGTADDAVLAALSTTDGKVTLIKAKTDSLTFTVANQVDSNIQYVNDVAVTGDGSPGTEWGP